MYHVDAFADRIGDIMPGTVTLTGTAGSGQAVTAGVFGQIASVNIDFDKNLVQMNQGSTVIPPISVAAATTVTATKSGNAWTLVIS
jgi:hypothetical protein